MLDFLLVSTRSPKKDVVEIYPKFIVKTSSDLMIRGHDFYAIWIESKGTWSTREQDAIDLIDSELDKFAEENKDKYSEFRVKILHLWDSEYGMVDRCQKQMPDSFHMLDEKLIFSNMPTCKEDYASKRLSYPLEKGETPAYDKLMSVLYSPDEQKKIEWAIGSIVTGDSVAIQKFLVLYGAAGTGKSTVLNIIQQLFEGYYSVFDAKSLGSSNNAFALEAFKTNPLVAIQHDGDLSRIEDNTRLNSLVSHEWMTVNEKFKSTYASRFKCFLFMGTNKPVKITDSKSGLIRRLIDVSPTGRKLSAQEYKATVRQIKFELGPIAWHCKEVYENNRDLYDDYIPTSMLGASNDFYNFMMDSYRVFKKNDGTTMSAAWEMYDNYCKEAKVQYPYTQRIFKEELKSYFWEFQERFDTEDGDRLRSYYKGFRTDRFEKSIREVKKDDGPVTWLSLRKQKSNLDKEYANCPAQLATETEKPKTAWSKVKTVLADIDTSLTHYVKPPSNHIVIDLDLVDEDGNKSLELNLAEAAKWPVTYAEVSKSGCAIHLHYIYNGDVSKLAEKVKDHVEIKKFTGGSSLRRKLTKCFNHDIAIISSGLPLKGEKQLVNVEQIKSEKGLRKLIIRNLNKEIHPGTKPSIDFIKKILDDAYASGLSYDVSDMYNALMAFAAQSTNHPDFCMSMVDKMKLASEKPIESEKEENENDPIIFYDVEVFPNLFVICYKTYGDGKRVTKLISPSPAEVERLIQHKLVGFNDRKYDRHIIYARWLGYSEEELYKLSKSIIQDGKGHFPEAYGLGYTDVYDFSSKKQSLKKFEIELGIHHQELGLPWDQPVPEELWEKVADYCCNDVIATEAVFEARKADFVAREILADVAGMTVNDTTNSLTTRIIFGKERNPQSQFNYRDMGDSNAISKEATESRISNAFSYDPEEVRDLDEFTVFDSNYKPIFPGYTYSYGKSIYRGEEVGEGGYVYAEPGIHLNVALLDIASMHPSSIVAEELFGKTYTARFEEILKARIAIKHKDFEKAKKMLGGKLAKYLTDEESAADLAQALKIAINSVYGLTSATFDNPFRDIRNKDNIVAKRGALFMVNLKHEVQKRGFTVAHIKTDSIKIPNATPEIIKFVMDYGRIYGYNFEHEATYDRFCLVNKADYIAKYKDGKHAGEWTATGAQFQVPYIFKTLFTHEPIVFDDLCETKSVTKGEIFLDMNEDLPDVSDMEKELKKAKDKFAHGTLSDTSYDEIKQRLEPEIAKGHNYIYVGRVGRFCPIKSGCGGGVLYRVQDGRYYAVTGTSGYRWLESEIVKNLGKEGDIDETYYISLAEEAKRAIYEYGDFEIFTSETGLSDFMNPPEPLPF